MVCKLFHKRHLILGRKLLESHSVKHIVFSGGTYQVEVFDKECEDVFWPFLQITDLGEVLDSFCSCDDAESMNSCKHLAAAYLYITALKPIHLQFKDSIWSKLCMMGLARHGDSSSVLLGEGDSRYVIHSEHEKTLFAVNILTDKGRRFLNEEILNKKIETEETSLKFSNLSPEELLLWGKGTPSQELQYELSFWAEFAKWMLLEQVFNHSYRVQFQMINHELPKSVELVFDDLSFEFYIASVNWKQIIPSLIFIQSNLIVHEFKDIQIQSIRYNPKEKALHVNSKPLLHPDSGQEIAIGEWVFNAKYGFHPSNKGEMFYQPVIHQHQLQECFKKYFAIIEKYLVGTAIYKKHIKLSYNIFFDEDYHLHIDAYAFEKGDLSLPNSVIFNPWMYIPNKGFNLYHEEKFSSLQTVISYTNINQFINKYRVWLNNYNGFRTHTSYLEMVVKFSFNGQDLWFFSDFVSDYKNDVVVDFGDWFYIPNKGFYHKIKNKRNGDIILNTKISRDGVSKFIDKYYDDLESVKNFFSSQSPLSSAVLDVTIGDHDQIHIQPYYTYDCSIDSEETIDFIGDYTYEPNKGFFKIPLKMRLPERYRDPVNITKRDEPEFLQSGILTILPFVRNMDSRLKRPKYLKLQLKKIEKDKGNDWKMLIVYKSDLGEEPLHAIYQAIHNGDSYVLTHSGLLFMNDKQFDWLRATHQSASDGLKLSMCDWFRLQSTQNIEYPLQNSPEGQSMSHLLNEIKNFSTDIKMNLSGLKSVLRPYQITGAKWLWFLYLYGLSGLLCDDMGLGKTHQSMALLSAVYNYRKKDARKCIVICPTSVIYHWEELLSQFLPSITVEIFYGNRRSLATLKSTANIVVTSYGVFRAEHQHIKKILFEVAILDEIQIAKNPHSQMHQALLTLQAKTIVGLSGTPIENRIEELKALFDIVLPGYLPDRARFREEFSNPIEKNHDVEQQRVLSNMIHPFILRRKKSDVLEDLPAKTEEIAYSLLSEDQQRLYNQVTEKGRPEILKVLSDNDANIPYMHIFSMFNQLKQICNHPCTFYKDIDHYKNYKSGKWDLFIELLEEARGSGQKLVVFSQYLGMIKLIKLYLKEHNIGHSSITGATRNRKKELVRFKEDPDCKVFVASLKAAGTGVDMTAASVVIHYDRWWNPAKENQATDRVHRIGQSRGVQVFKMVTKQTIEEYIDQMINSKMQLNERLIGYDNQDDLKRLSRQDLIECFKKL